MNLKYLKEYNILFLKNNIGDHLEYYLSDEPWLSTVFKNDEWFLNSKVIANDVDLKMGTSPKNDLENSIILYDSFKHLNIVQASDERLWSYLTHIYFWDYMRSRWGLENRNKGSDAINFIKRRYFLESNKHISLVRNGISRLWWFGYISYDPTREDPFELTRFLLSKQDFAHSLMERTFSRNKKIVNALLSALIELQESHGLVVGQAEFRTLSKRLNNLGGISIIDTLDKKDINQIVQDTLQVQKITS